MFTLIFCNRPTYRRNRHVPISFSLYVLIHLYSNILIHPSVPVSICISQSVNRFFLYCLSFLLCLVFYFPSLFHLMFVCFSSHFEWCRKATAVHLNTLAASDDLVECDKSPPTYLQGLSLCSFLCVWAVHTASPFRWPRCI